MTKRINNIRDNHHLNSKYWQNYKKGSPDLPKEIFDVAVGMILGDATMYRVSREAYIKFEQGYKQKDFLDTLFAIFNRYTFMRKPGIRSYLSGLATSQPKGLFLRNQPKTFWFKTFSHESFTRLFVLFYQQEVYNGKITYKKRISQDLILNYLTLAKLRFARASLLDNV